MPKEQSPGKQTTRRYTPEEKASAVRISALRVVLADLRARLNRLVCSSLSAAIQSLPPPLPTRPASIGMTVGTEEVHDGAAPWALPSRMFDDLLRTGVVIRHCDSRMPGLGVRGALARHRSTPGRFVIPGHPTSVGLAYRQPEHDAVTHEASKATTSPAQYTFRSIRDPCSTSAPAIHRRQLTTINRVAQSLRPDSNRPCSEA
jgi:hypothetical protein